MIDMKDKETNLSLYKPNCSRTYAILFQYDNLQERISSFGWDTKMVDGHDMQSIRDSFNDMDGDRPLCIILDTIKGKGVSFMENPAWHCKVPTDEEYEIAMKELGV